ncbi:unnamed protein product [Ceutorhynchus assimilis]|uniref:FHA domain-containing protein n=1 Tax=Ceutorhynchus assimilis TaxID=467358 RepID=A0A9N9QQ93_9CUCU|nr:unnamed protein product [Ceutorhynchus assimilis]
MSSKKNRTRDSSSSSNSSRASSPDSRKKHGKHSKSHEKRQEKNKPRESGRTRRSVSKEQVREPSKYRRSRSRSNERQAKHRNRSRSRNESQSRDNRSRSREARRYNDRDNRAGGSRHDRGNHRDFRDRSRNNQNDGRDFRRNDNRRRRNSPSFDHANAKWGKGEDNPKDKKKQENKAKPDFGLSGKLTEETNTYKGVVIKYSEPPEARKPKRRWRLYPFKGDKALQTLYIHRESAYLIGRDRKVVDLAVDHPSCSKQHAALQYRLVPFTRDDGSSGKRVRPYIIDLESANGTFLNNNKIEAKKYVELLERDVLKFGFSSREYVLLHENSKDETMDDDVKVEDEEVKKELEITDVKEEEAALI